MKRKAKQQNRTEPIPNCNNGRQMPQIYSFIFFLFFRCFNFTFKLFGVYAMWLVVVIIITLPGLLGAHTYTLTPVHRVAFLDFFIGKHTQTCARTAGWLTQWTTIHLQIFVFRVANDRTSNCHHQHHLQQHDIHSCCFFRCPLLLSENSKM